MTKRPPLPTPSPTDFRSDNEFLIQITDEQPDDLGRAQFVVFWPQPNPPFPGACPGGVRAQVSFASFADFIARTEARGASVRALDDHTQALIKPA